MEARKLLEVAQQQDGAASCGFTPYVTKNGGFKMPRIGPKDGHKGGSNAVQWVDQKKRADLHWLAEEDGCVLYEDMCRGRYTPVNGGEPVAMPEKWDEWKDAIRMIGFNDEGTPSVELMGLPEDFYHPEVYARRKAYNLGVRQVNYPTKKKETVRGKAQL